MTWRRFLPFVLALVLFLPAFANKFAETDAKACGYSAAPFDQFVSCIRADFKKADEDATPKTRSDYDFSNKSVSESRNELYGQYVATLDQLADDYRAAKKRTKRKKKSAVEDSFYSRFDNVRANFTQQQTAANEKAAAVAAVLVGGAALVAICAKGGCNGGGGAPAQSHTDHQGCCSWHGGITSICRAGRVVCSDGELSPSCRC